MNKLSLPRLLGLSVLCVALAILVGLQALSSIATRQAPDQAAMLFPLNGIAKEQLAFRQFRTKLSDGVAIPDAAQDALAIARNGLSSDPLAPKSHALLAMAESDPDKRRAILAAAKTLNRRDLALQGVVLEQHLENEQFAQVVETLDQMLRVHPDRSETFFPLLIAALKVDEAAPQFPRIVNGDAAWHVDFVREAARDDEALVNLASIRAEIPIDDRPFDSLLITGLARIGEMETALSLYQERVELPRSRDARETGEWPSDYPPFDWALAEQSDFRAQTTRDGENLELYSRSGQGGVMARRVIQSPKAPFVANSSLTMRATGRSEAVRFNLRCVGAQDRFFDEAYEEGDNQWRIEKLPDDCSQLVLEVTARTLRGDPTLRAEVSPIELNPS
ncbi:MAG: hypothetical protein AAGL10_14125 [Pseudomonadota bacterium]